VRTGTYPTTMVNNQDPDLFDKDVFKIKVNAREDTNPAHQSELHSGKSWEEKQQSLEKEKQEEELKKSLEKQNEIRSNIKQTKSGSSIFSFWKKY